MDSNNILRTQPLADIPQIEYCLYSRKSSESEEGQIQAAVEKIGRKVVQAQVKSVLRILPK